MYTTAPRRWSFVISIVSLFSFIGHESIKEEEEEKTTTTYRANTHVFIRCSF
jgi:hypothetical protein